MNPQLAKGDTSAGVVSLAQLLQDRPTPKPCLLEPGLLPHQGILFVGGEPKVGKSLLVANLALALASGGSTAGFEVSNPCRVLLCQFELPLEHFASRLIHMRQALGSAADNRLLVDTQSQGHLLNTSQGLNHFLAAARAAKAQVIVLDPLYSTHDQDENDTRAMAALCQTLLRLRDASQASLIVVHHVRKSINRNEIGTAFRGSSALHAVGDSYVLLTRNHQRHNTIELRFQFRYAAAQQPKLLCLDTRTLWFESADDEAPPEPTSRHKVAPSDVQRCFPQQGQALRFNQLRHQIMTRSQCSKRTAQLAIKRACEKGVLVRHQGQYRLPL